MCSRKLLSMSIVTAASAASQAAVVGTDLGSFVKMVTTSGMVLGRKVVPSRGSARPQDIAKIQTRFRTDARKIHD